MFFANTVYTSQKFGVTKLAFCTEEAEEHRFDDVKMVL